MAHSKMAPKRKVNVRGQKHSLAYINDREKRMLRQAGGSGKPGPNGIPTYDDLDEGYGAEDMGGAAGGSPGTGGGSASDDIGGGFGGGSGDDNNNNNNYSAPSRSIPVPTPRPKKPADQIAREKAKAEVQTRIDRLNNYSKKEDTNFINRNAAKANVLGAQRVADKLSEKGSVAIRDKSGQVVGAIHDGLFGRVYSGRMLDKDNYTGPAEFANQVTMDRGDGSGDDNIRGGAKPKEEVVESIDGEVNLPEAPKSGEGGDATDDAKKRSKMGKESTISTTSQGLLGSAKTRNRSLMSGLIS